MAAPLVGRLGSPQHDLELRVTAAALFVAIEEWQAPSGAVPMLSSVGEDEAKPLAEHTLDATADAIMAESLASPDEHLADRAWPVGDGCADR